MENLQEISYAIKDIEKKMTDQEYKNIQDMLKKVYDQKTIFYKINYIECTHNSYTDMNLEKEELEVYTKCFKEHKTAFFELKDEIDCTCYSNCCFKKGIISKYMIDSYEDNDFLIINENDSHYAGDRFTKNHIYFIINMQRV